MRLESRNRGYGTTDLLIIPENEQDSQLIEKLGEVGTKICGEIRLADGYCEHYVLIRAGDKYE